MVWPLTTATQEVPLGSISFIIITNLPCYYVAVAANTTDAKRSHTQQNKISKTLLLQYFKSPKTKSLAFVDNYIQIKIIFAYTKALIVIV